jgi:hypothetical protein
MKLCVNPSGTWPCFLGEGCGFFSGSCIRPTSGYTACSSSGAVVATESITSTDDSSFATTSTDDTSTESSRTVIGSSSTAAAIHGKTDGQLVNLAAALVLGAIGL